MVKPDINDGHIDIANELAEALMKVNLSGHQYRIIWCIFRKTYGWHKSTDKISLTQFEKMAGLKRQRVNETIKKLEALNIIIVDRNGYVNIYKFNTDYDTWKIKDSTEICTSTENRTTLVRKTVPKLVQKTVHTKENKETIQKKYIDIFNYWNSKEIITHKKLDQATSRSINAKLKDYSLEEIKKAIHHYWIIQKNEDDLYYWNHKWTLKDFLQRGFEKFKDWDIAHENYLKNEFRGDKLK